MWLQRAGQRAVASSGVDSGQLMLLGSKAAEKYDAQDDGADGIEWPTIVLKDGRRLRAGGVDFFNWAEPLPGIGKSANDLVSSGEATKIEPKGKRLPGKLNYSGACAASACITGFGYIGRKQQDEGVVFHVRDDGGYQMWRMRSLSEQPDAPDRIFGFVAIGREIEEPDAKVWMVRIGLIRTHGLVAFCDPCHGGGQWIGVEADPDGDTVIYGRYQEGQYGLCGFAVELV